MNVSFLKIVKSDLISVLSTIAIVVLPVLYIDFVYFGIGNWGQGNWNWGQGQ
jgi:hypothetical protein